MISVFKANVFKIKRSLKFVAISFDDFFLVSLHFVGKEREPVERVTKYTDKFMFIESKGKFEQPGKA
jgi:hypothetical protein